MFNIPHNSAVVHRRENSLRVIMMVLGNSGLEQNQEQFG